MNQKSSLLRFVLVLSVLALGHADLWSCTACFGQSDSPMAKGMNMGIFTLLLFITCVLAGIASFFVYLIRRSSQLADSQAGASTHFSSNRSNA